MILFTVIAMPTAEADSPDPLFQDDAALRVEITAPFKRLIGNSRPVYCDVGVKVIAHSELRLQTALMAT